MTISFRDWSDLLESIRALTTEVHMASQALTDLQREVAEMKTINSSAVTLIQGLAEQIRQNAADEGAMRAMADDLDAQANTLAAAVQAGTPTQPATEPGTDGTGTP